MRGSFEVHQSPFFFLFAISKKAAGTKMLEMVTEEREKKEAYSYSTGLI